MRRPYIVATIPILIFLLASASAQQTPSGNLAPSARAIASSAAEGSKPENLIDGDIAHTQWTAKDGTNPADTWAELNWPMQCGFKRWLSAKREIQS